MSPAPRIAALLVLALGLVGLLAPAAPAAEGIGPAKKLDGSRTTTTTTATSTSTPRANTGTKEQLAIATKSPAAGATVSGTVVWEVSVLAGAPSKIEFAIDGVAVGSDASAPYGFRLDTAKLANGSHSLSATAYGSKGVKATTAVTVKVAMLMQSIQCWNVNLQ